MLPVNLCSLVQSQFNAERQNEVIYRALASAADVVNRPGAKKYFAQAATEEARHAQKFADYLIDRGEMPAYYPIEGVTQINGNDYGGLFRTALGLERNNTAALSGLYWMASDDDGEGDPQTVAFLIEGGFLSEQTEAERELSDMLIKIGRLSEDGLEVFDQSLSA